MKMVSEKCVSVLIDMWNDEIVKIVNSGEELCILPEEKDVISKYPHIVIR